MPIQELQTHTENPDIAGILARVRAACAVQPRRYVVPVDTDAVTITSVNVPFPTAIDSEALADALHRNAVPIAFAGHVARFLGELPLVEILRFCDRHGIGADDLAAFVATHGQRLALRRPDLTEHLDALVSHP